MTHRSELWKGIRSYQPTNMENEEQIGREGVSVTRTPGHRETSMTYGDLQTNKEDAVEAERPTEKESDRDRTSTLGAQSERERETKKLTMIN